jgi:hydrophobic/amphiphilic exporter-1 (mainly G- bacteria), HAE1 family
MCKPQIEESYMTLAERSLKRPVTAIMVFVSFVVFGLFAARLLKLESFPEFNAPFVLVNIPYPGASPKEVERDIVRPVEAQLATISGVSNQFSQANEDGATFFMIFGYNQNLKLKVAEVRERVDAARADLPDDVQRVFVRKFSTTDEAAITIRLTSKGRELSKAYEFINRKLKRPLERIAGVASVDIAGVEPNEVEIALLPERIASFNVDLNQLARTLASSNFSISGGFFHDGPQRFRIQPVGELSTLEEIGALQVTPAGVRLRDIAELRLRAQKTDAIRILNGEYAVGLDIQVERNANLVDVCRAIMAEINRISAELEGVQLIVVENQGDGVESSLGELVEAGVLGSFLSMLVLYFFLRHWPSTLMVSLAVPICLTMTLGAMYFLGFTLNILTMMGLLLGVGMLVDNAVVVVESIYQQREKNPNEPKKAAIEGVRMVQLAVSAGTLTSIIVFLPVVFGGTTLVSKFLYYVAMPLTISLLCSWLVSISIIPMLAARIAPPKGIEQVRVVEAWKDRYERILRWTIRRKWTTVSLMILVSVSVAIPFGVVKFDAFPSRSDRTFRAGWDIQGNYSLPELERAARSFEQFLLANKTEFEIESVYSYVSQTQGGVNTRIQMIEERSMPIWRSVAYQIRKAWGQRPDAGNYTTLDPEALQTLIRDRMPQFAVGTPNFRSGGGFGGGGGTNTNEVELNIEGDSGEVLAALSTDVARYLQAKVPALKDVRSDLGNDQKEIRIRVDRERAAALGFTAQQVASTVQVAMRGSPLREFRTEDGEVPMWLRFKDSESISLDALTQVRLTRPSGESVPLDALVSVNSAPGPSAINRMNGRTTVTIRATKPEGVELDEIRKEVNKAISEFPFPPGYGLSFGASFEDDAKVLSEMGFSFILALILIYMVMAALFESYSYPFSILISVVFSIVGVFWTFLVWPTVFSIMAFIGVMILIGVVVNNGIILVEHVNNLREAGMARAEALVIGGKERLRPILITTACTVLGLAPLCVGNVGIGGDGPPYFPMARAIAGGLIFSTVVSLLVLPTAYALIDDFSNWMSRAFRQSKSARLSKVVQS